MKKRLLAMLLALVLVFSLLPSVVIAEGEEHVHCLCGADKTKGTVCAECGSEAVVWTATDAMPANNAEGYYYLTATVTKAFTSMYTKNVAICLNSCNIETDRNAGCLSPQKGSVVTITDCDGDDTKGIMTGTKTKSTFAVMAGGTLKLYGGTISGNTNGSTTGAGIVWLQNGTADTDGGAFYMYGGKITDNTTKRGAVFTEFPTDATAKPASIQILGGEITGNTGTNTIASTGGGAGIYAAVNVVVGGDAKVYGNTGSVTSGTIPNADIYLRNDNAAYSGQLVVSADVPLREGANIQYGSKPVEADLTNLTNITGTPENWNSDWVSYDGQKVGFAEGKFFVDDGSATPDDEKHIHCLCGLEKTEGNTCAKCGTKAEVWTATTTIPTADGRYYLKETIKTGKVDLKANVSLCLHDKNWESAAGAAVVKVWPGYSLEITSCSETPGAITGATATTAVDVQPNAHFTLWNGKITGNMGEAGQNGTIWLAQGNATQPGATFTMYGGEISNNKTGRGAIFTAIPGDAAYKRATVRLLGGKITGNEALTSDEKLGGGAGVYALSPVEIGGNIQIFGNTAAVNADDIYLRNDGIFTGSLVISSEVPLESGAKVSYGLKNAEQNLSDLEWITGAPTVWEDTYVTYDGQAVLYKDGKFYIDTGLLPAAHIHCLCGAEKTEGNTCAKCGTKAEVWTATTTMPTADGRYYLKETIKTGKVDLKANVSLCLHAKNWESAAGAAVVKVWPGYSLEITSCSETPGSITGAKATTAVEVQSNATFTLWNGKITGNMGEAGQNGTIWLAQGNATQPGATFTMYGGEISNNKTGRGAIFTAIPGDAAYKRATVRLLGGKITGNEALTSDEKLGGGAGVYALSPVEIGGNIQIFGNTAAVNADDIYLRNDGDFTGSLIISSEVPLESGAKVSYGLKNAEQNLSELQWITGAPAAWEDTYVTYDGQAVLYKDGKFYINTGLLPAAHIHCLCGAEKTEGNECAKCGTKAVIWQGITEMPNANAPGYYYLQGDVAVTPFFAQSTEFAFCLCGHTMTSATGLRMFDASKGAVISITDCGEEMGILTGTKGVTSSGADAAGAIIRVNEGSVVNFYNGKITGHTGNAEGLLYVDMGSKEVAGGAFNMYGGEISGNTCKRGAIFTALAAGDAQPGSIKILGGVITGNTGTATGKTGGGAGVYSFYPIEIGGNAQIYGNTAQVAPADLYVRDDMGAKIVLSKDVPLTEGAKIVYGTKSIDNPEDLLLITGAPAAWDNAWVTYDGQPVKYKDGKFYTAAEIVISNHDHDGQKWISVSEETQLVPYKDGYYVLDGDVQLEKAIVVQNGNHVHLCLNGHTLKAAEGTLHFDLQPGAKLTICDCTAKTAKNGKYTAGSITGGSGANGGAIRAREGSEVYLYDGIFCENTTAGNGGVIYMDGATAEHPGAIFHMYGGMLCNNFGGYGGAVRLGNPAAGLAGPTFRMEGGIICHNESHNYGAALHAANNATVELLGGVIEKNVAAQGGGALSINGTTTVNLSGTVIRNNSATTWGGGVYIKSGAIMNMTGGEISGNSSKVGAGVLMESKGTTLNLSGGQISGNKAGAAGGAGIYASSNTLVNMTGGQIKENVSEAGGGGVIISKATASFTGGKITGNKSVGGGAGLCLKGSEILLGNVIVSENASEGGAGGIYVAREGAVCSNVIIDGAQIVNNTSKSSGGGMFVYMNGNVVTMKSGKINGNRAQNGGGVLVQRECTFTMEGGEISNNRSDGSGGGYYASIDSTFIMNGGVISGNYANGSGGGVYILRAAFELNGGTISYNSSKGSAGGVMVNGSKGSFNGTWVTNNESTASSGGGVMVVATTMKVDGVSTRFPAIVSINAGRISKNKTPKAGAGLLLQAKDTVVNMYGGQISENVATKFAGGVYVGKNAMFNMHGGAVCYNVTENDVAGGIRHDGGGGNYTGGEIYGNSTTRSAGGILVGGNYNKVTLKNVKIYDNTAKVGAGIVQQSKGCEIIMENCEFYGNKASQEGAAIYCYSYANLIAKNCHIHDNVAQVNGAGVWSWATSDVTLDGCTIEGNQSVEGQGAGVWTRGDVFKIIGCTIRNNTSGGNGAGVCTGMMGSATPRYTPGLKMEDTLLENNVSGGQGGGLYQCSGSEGNLKNVKFIGNKAAAEGGALWAVDEFTMHSVTATGNISGGEGYAIYLADSDFDGYSYFNGLMKASGSMIIHDNQGGDLYLGEKTSMAIGEQGLAEDARIDVTLHSGLLTDWVWGAYNYEGGNQMYTITYGDRSIVDPEIPADELVEDPSGEQEPSETPTEGQQGAPKGNVGLIAGIAAVVVVIAAAAVTIVAVSKKKKAAK